MSPEGESGSLELIEEEVLSIAELSIRTGGADEASPSIRGESGGEQLGDFAIFFFFFFFLVLMVGFDARDDDDDRDGALKEMASPCDDFCFSGSMMPPLWVLQGPPEWSRTTSSIP